MQVNVGVAGATGNLYDRRSSPRVAMKARGRGILLGVTWVLAFVSEGTAQTSRPNPNVPPVFAVRGAGSCAAAACHGSVRPSASGILRTEHTTWIERDPHANAFKTLTNERSRSIAKNLSGGGIPAHRDERCLACHVTPVPSPGRAGLDALVNDGVGCESCHGPSGTWIGEHTRIGWAGRPSEEKARFGMVATSDIVRRAETCAECHVGAPARSGLPTRDVNHDLIAAGHPRLNFEFSGFQANMPKHWRGDTRPDADPNFPARGWAIGQAVAAKTALDLLAERARHARKGEVSTSWPEFAEFGCFTCHHDLRDDPWRRQKAVVSTPPGRTRWGSWYYPMLETLIAFDHSPESESVAAGLTDLRSLMDAPNSEATRIANAAESLSGRLSVWLNRLSNRIFDAAAVADLLGRIDALPSRGLIRSWDEATQRYLGLVPLTQALEMIPPGRIEPGRKEALKAHREQLKFPEGSDSPSSFNPTSFR